MRQIIIRANYLTRKRGEPTIGWSEIAVKVNFYFKSHENIQDIRQQSEKIELDEFLSLIQTYIRKLIDHMQTRQWIPRPRNTHLELKESPTLVYSWRIQLLYKYV